MSHHLVTVCMFCLLCAAHTCGSHIDPNNDLTYKTIPQEDIHHMTDINETRKDSEDKYHENTDLPYAQTIQSLEEIHHRKDELSRTDSIRYNQKLEKLRNNRKKREIVNNIDPNKFVEKIFSLYGDPKTMTMNMSGFNSMLDVLDLRKLVEGGKAEKTESYMFGSKDEDDVNVSLKLS